MGAGTGLLNNDTLGTPPATLVNWGGGDASGSVDLAPGASSVLAGGTLTVNADGSFDLVGPTTPGTYTFDYIIDNGVGDSQATVEIYVEDAPTATADSYTVALGSTDTSNNVTDNDDLGVPPAVVDFYADTGDIGGASQIASPNVYTHPTGGFQVTIGSDGALTIDASVGGVVAGVGYTFDYQITNGAGSAVATVTVDIAEIPVPANDDFTIAEGTSVAFDAAAPQFNAIDLLADNGNGPDDAGVPAFDTVEFGGGDLSGTVTDNTVTSGNNTTIPFPVAGGDLTINVPGDGSLEFSLSGTTSGTELIPGQHTFQYQLTNANGTSAPATVTLEVTQPPTAVDDGATGAPAYTVGVGSSFTSTTATGVRDSNDEWTLPDAFPDAEIVDYTDGTTTATFGNPLTLSGSGGVTVTIALDGTITVDATAGTAVAGDYQVTYTLGNVGGTDTATVFIRVTENPVAQDDADTTLFDTALNVSAPGLLGNDSLGTPPAEITSFDVGGGPVTVPSGGSNTATLAGGTLTVASDGIWSLTGQPFTPGQYTFDYTLDNGSTSDVATVTLDIEAPPTAVNDGATGAPAYTVGASTTSTTATGVRNSNDDYTLPNVFPVAEIVDYTDGVTTATVGNPLTLDGSGGVTVTIALDGTITVDATAGTAVADDYQFDYMLDNVAGTDTATVFIRVTENPVAQDDVFTFLNTDNQTTPNSLWNNNGNGPDELGTPLAETISFDVGGGPVAVPSGGSNTAALAGGTLTVASDGAWSLTGQPFTPGQYTFDYTLDNGVDSDDATVTLNIQAPPTAVDDDPGGAVAYDVLIGSNTTFSGTNGVRNRNDDWESPDVYPDAEIADYTDGVTTATVGNPLTLSGSGGVTVTIALNGTITIDATADTAIADDYQFTYTLSNGTTDSTATVTIRVNALPTVTQATVEENGPTFNPLPEQSAGTPPTSNDNPNLAFVFSESVTLNAGAFSVVCGTSGDVTGQYSASATPSTSVFLTYGGGGLTQGETCTVTLVSDNVVDGQGNTLDGNGDGVENGSPADDEVYEFVVDTALTLTLVEVEVGGVYTTVAGTFPGDGVNNVDDDTTIRTTFSEPVNDNGGTTVSCDVSGTVGTGGSGLTVTGNGTNQLVLTRTSGTFSPDELCTITFNEPDITDVDNADTPDNLLTPSPASYEFRIVDVATPQNDAFTVTSHLEARFDTVAPGTTNVISNDSPAGSTVTEVNGTAIGSPITLGSGAIVTMEADGDFNYVPPPGAGNGDTDSFDYTLQTTGGATATATVTITIEGPVIWYVDADASGPYDGTAANPFANLTGANSFNANAVDATGEYIFVYDSASNGSAFQCGLTLLDGQTVIGEGEIAGTLNTLTGRAPVAETVGTPPDTTGNQPQLTSTGDCFAFDGNNTVRGLDIVDTTGGAAFVDSGATVGNATIADVSVNGAGSIVEFLNGGTLTANFNETSSSGSPSTKINLVNLNGTLNSASGTLNHAAAGTDMMFVSGGNVGGTIGASFNQTGGNAMLNVNGGHTGTFMFNANMTANTGDGMQFNNADGTYTFNNRVFIDGETGAATTAGVNIENGSDGTLNILSTASLITRTGGIPFRVNNSAMDVDYNGNITHRNPALLTARPVEIIGGTGVISLDGTIAHGDSTTFATAETVYLEDTGAANTISFDYVDAFMEDSAVLKSLTSGNIAINRFRLYCSGNLPIGVDTHCIQISDTISSGVTIEAITANLDNAGDSGGAISLTNTPGDWIVEQITYLAGSSQPTIYGSNFGTLNIATVDSGTSPGGISPGPVSNSGAAAFDLTNGTVNINVTTLSSSNVTDHGINLVNVDGPLFQITGDLTVTGGPEASTTNELIFIDNTSVTQVDFGTDGTTDSTVLLDQRQTHGLTVTGTVTSTPIRFGNTSIPNPYGVPDAAVNSAGYGGTLDFASGP